MAKYFIPNMEVVVSTGYRFTDIYHKGKLVFTSKKVCIFRILEDNVLAIVEDCVYNLNESRITFFRLDENEEIKTTYFNIELKHDNIFDYNLQEEKELIIPGVCKKFIYSYEYDLIISNLYDNIIYDDETNTFQVKKILRTNEGIVKLFGILDIDGFLLNESMYIPELDLEVYVDPLNLENSLKERMSLIEKKLKKRNYEREIKEFFKFEEEIYLKRKRK